MKYCLNCGTQNEDDFAFCKTCGVQLQNTNNNPQQTMPYGSQPMYSQQPNVQPPAYQPPPYWAPPSTQPNPVFSTSFAQNVIKSAGSSMIFLVATILVSLSLLFSIINGFIPVNINHIFENTNFRESLGSNYSNVYDVFTKYQGFFSGFSLIALIPTLLICIGLWLFYFTCKDANNPNIKTSGLTIIKGVIIFNFIITCLIPLFFLMALIIASTSLNSLDIPGSGGGAAIGVMLILFILSCVIVIFPMIYCIFIIKSINNLKRTAQNVSPAMPISNFVAVMNIIFGSISVLAVLSNINSFPSVFSVIASFCSAASLIAIAICIFNYNNEICK
ncbi:MAG: zinc ribbon domain-containing protein [Bacillota bacterium]|nr:zinc ribbon domain-containing protein [Bacillota bacterium]